MLNLVDLLIAGFIFLLFASVYRKRSTVAVRFWMLGWFFVLLHFATLLFQAKSPAAETCKDIATLSTLILCGISFVLSREESHRTRFRTIAVTLLLGGPWIASIAFATLPRPLFFDAALCAYVGAISMLVVSVRLFSSRRLQTLLLVLVAAGCTVWLTISAPDANCGTVLAVVLTECFGLNAILLSGGGSRWSAAKVTTSAGAIAWAGVWFVGNLVFHFAPKAVISPEVWNLPKYFVAAGMILMLLEEEIRSAELASEQYRLLFASNPHPMWMYDPESFAILEANDAAVASYGFSPDEFRSMRLLDVISGEQMPEMIAKLKLRDSGPQQLSGSWEHRRKNGSTLQVDIATQPVLHGGRRVMFALMHDVTEQQRLNSQLLHQAHHDVLTGLPNRALFEQRLHAVLAEARESGTKAAVFCMDLDRLKQINDSYGHAAGDLCLRKVATRLAERLQESGTVARTGGDEFMLVLGDLRTVPDAENFARALLADLSTAVQFRGGDLEVGASIGMAIFPDDGGEADQLWRDADAAMYQAKRAGGSQWLRVSQEISSMASQANEIELALRRALKAGDLQVQYQPQMTIDGSFYSLEALLRSTDPVLKVTPTDRMISIAEESGLIVSLGNWVLEEVCRQCRAWIDEGFAPVRMAVNVSPLQLMRFDFSRHVAKLLSRYDLSARNLEFEVTESTVMPDRRSDAVQQIATLARMGIRFSVDDFGTGYSSLGRLHQLPVESLKIDQSFTRRIAELNGTFPTVEAIIVLAHTFGMKVVAEGVETDEQLTLLKSLGCDRVQGYLFSRPLTAEATTSLLRSLEEDSIQESVA